MPGEWCGGRALGGAVFGQIWGLVRLFLRIWPLFFEEEAGTFFAVSVRFFERISAQTWALVFGRVLKEVSGPVWEKIVGSVQAERGAKWDGRSGPGRMGL